MLEGEVQLRSKRELSEKFIREQMPKVSSGDAVKSSFETFWCEEQVAALEELCEQEELFEGKVQKVISDFNFTGQTRLCESIVATMRSTPKIL